MWGALQFGWCGVGDRCCQRPNLSTPHLPVCHARPTGWADFPWWYVDTWSRVKHAVVMTNELLQWVKTAHPYWNRTQVGRPVGVGRGGGASAMPSCREHRMAHGPETALAIQGPALGSTPSRRPAKGTARVVDAAMNRATSAKAPCAAPCRLFHSCQGADHIWLFAHDEGACWAPKELYENSIILTHWGRLDKRPASGTSYYPVRPLPALAEVGSPSRCL